MTNRHIVSSGCKLNLGLRVLRRREDGFHDIETVMYPIPGLHDVMEFIPVAGSTDLELIASGIVVDCPAKKNLCYKAWRLLHEAHNIAGGQFYIHKSVPTGAGLGGGSANAAAALELISAASSLALPPDQIALYGARLGSDVPFFCQGTTTPSPMLAEGRGERLTPITIDLTGHYLVILKPPVGVSTSQAYAGITPQENTTPLSQIIPLGLEKWREANLTNDFEHSIFTLYPILSELKDLLYERGAIYAAMSGSGSAIFGIFPQKTPTSDLPYHIYSRQL